jgi:acetamidase/formamidase
LILIATLASTATGFTAGTQSPAGELYVPSRPETVVLGSFPIDRAPVLTIRSGQTVRIDTISQRGATQDENPVTYLGALGVEPHEILKDVVDFWASRAKRTERNGHILTGPIYIEDAAPGDTLEVQILGMTTRVPYGINSTTPTAGVIKPDYAARPGDTPMDLPEHAQQHLIRTGEAGGRAVAFFSDKIRVPLNPFMGTMAVAPRNPVVGEPGVAKPGVQGSGPPGPYGGNMDFKALTPGASLFLPVFHPGARFYTGDPHGVQGDGEVSGNALEQSLTGVFRFVLHKGKTISGPRAETPTHFVMMGIDLDLDRALRLAVGEVVTFLTKEKGLTHAKALSLASLAVDFHIAEAVDGTQVVVGKIPKSLFPE